MTKKMTIKRILIYILISFLLPWIALLVSSLCGNTYESDVTQIILSFAMLCPTIAVLATIKLTKEDILVTGEKSLNLGISLNGKKKWWFLLGIFTPVIYVELGYLLYYVFFPKAYDLALLDEVVTVFGVKREMLWVVTFYFMLSAIWLSFCALGEEIGWRAYLYPKLEEVMGEGKAILVGGVIWAVWHFPMLYIGHNFGKGYWGEPWTGFAAFTIYCVAIGSVLYFFTKKTKSVWAAGFMHSIHNTIAGASLLKMMQTEEGVPKWALESPVSMLLSSVPVIILGGVLIGISFYKSKDKGQLKKTENAS